MLTYVNSSIWQRRTNKIIAAAVIFVGLTMLISTIPQCIYAGLAFIALALGWLGWVRMKESKAEPPRPPTTAGHATSPVLFLVSSTNMTPRESRVPTPPDPNDKPPTYDQIVKLDGLPPDYITILTEKPPRYEDIDLVRSGLKLCSRSSGGIPVEIMQYPSTAAAAVAQVHSYGQAQTDSSHNCIVTSLSAGSTSLAGRADESDSDMSGLHYCDVTENQSKIASTSSIDVGRADDRIDPQEATGGNASHSRILTSEIADGGVISGV